MRLLRIDTNKGNKIDGGFRHTTFDITKVNGERKINIVSSIKFDSVLTHPLHIEQFRKDPDELLRSVTDENDLSDNNSNGNGDDAA